MTFQELPVIGSHVTYHGSIAECHGRTYRLAPSREADGRYTLLDPDGRQDIENVRADSFTPTRDTWWPAGAVAMDIAGYRYMAHHAGYGGSARARTIHHHLQGGGLAQAWCRFHEPTEAIRTLDARRRAGVS